MSSGRMQRRDRRLRDLERRCDPARGEGEAEHLAAGVSHEHPCGSVAAQVEREEREAGIEQRERDDEDGGIAMQRRGVDREEESGDRGECRREAVHVVEHVERVRQPDEPERREREREPVVRDDRDLEAAGENDGRRRELRTELRDRRQAEHVVDKACDEEHGATRQDPEHLFVRPVTAPTATAARIPAAKPAKMPTPPKYGVARLCQRSSRGLATKRSAIDERRRT